MHLHTPTRFKKDFSALKKLGCLSLLAGSLLLGCQDGPLPFNLQPDGNPDSERDPDAQNVDAVTSPVISGLSAPSGASGSTLTLSGTGFSSTPADNQVFFGIALASVTAASPTSLTVTVPTLPPGRVDIRVAVADQTSANTAADDFTIEANNSLPSGMRFVDIPAGSFMMGSPEGEGRSWEHPQHQVSLSGFQLQTTEVTQKQWWDVMGSWPLGSDPAYPGRAMSSNAQFGAGDNYPMSYISWCDIVGASGDPNTCSAVPAGQSFLDKLNAQGHGTYRLPTEAEWEYAARAGTTSTYACGEYVEGATGCPGAMAWLPDERGVYGQPGYGTKPVGTKQANAWGLYDMYGNVLEWTQDWEGEYTSDAQTNPTGPATGERRIIRGGAIERPAYHATSAYRHSVPPGVRNIPFGFRLVRVSGS